MRDDPLMDLLSQAVAAEAEELAAAIRPREGCLSMVRWEGVAGGAALSAAEQSHVAGCRRCQAVQARLALFAEPVAAAEDDDLSTLWSRLQDQAAAGLAALLAWALCRDDDGTCRLTFGQPRGWSLAASSAVGFGGSSEPVDASATGADDLASLAALFRTAHLATGQSLPLQIEVAETGLRLTLRGKRRRVQHGWRLVVWSPDGQQMVFEEVDDGVWLSLERIEALRQSGVERVAIER